MDRSLITILIIDESVMVRRVLETLLERDGFSVLSAYSVPTAVQTMKAVTIDLVLMDVSPSHRNALVQTTEMRREFPDIKVIAMSGFFGGNPPLPSRLQAHACLSKPIRPDALRNSVYSLLAQHATPLPGVH
jgi:twitching motility two-component system response regulator PilH